MTSDELTLVLKILSSTSAVGMLGAIMYWILKVYMPGRDKEFMSFLEAEREERKELCARFLSSDERKTDAIERLIQACGACKKKEEGDGK